MKKVSVILPTYNREHTLGRAIASVLNQSYQDLELIIIDDGSIDQTKAVVSSFNDSRIKYFQLSANKGVSAARNAGIKLVSGTYVAFLDSDDEWSPEKIELQVKAFSELKDNCGLVFTNGYSGKSILVDDNFASRIVYGSKDMAKGLFPGNKFITPPSSWMLPYEVIKEIGEFDCRMANWEDGDYFVRVAQKFEIYFLNKNLVRWYVDSDHLNVLSEKLLKSKEIFIGKHLIDLKKDKEFLYKFYFSIAKDWKKLKNSDKYFEFLAKALNVRPWAVNVYSRIIENSWVAMINRLIR